MREKNAVIWLLTATGRGEEGMNKHFDMKEMVPHFSVLQKAFIYANIVWVYCSAYLDPTPAVTMARTRDYKT